MKTLRLLVIGLSLVTSGLQAFAKKPPTCLTVALLEVESDNNDNAIGDHGRARGSLQIWQILCDDVNKRYGTHYQAIDCDGNRLMSLKIHELYIDMYATKQRLGHEPTLEDMARIWNGGPLACFDNGAIDKKGRVFKSEKRRLALAALQKRAAKYYSDLVYVEIPAESPVRAPMK